MAYSVDGTIVRGKWSGSLSDVTSSGFLSFKTLEEARAEIPSLLDEAARVMADTTSHHFGYSVRTIYIWGPKEMPFRSGKYVPALVFEQRIEADGSLGEVVFDAEALARRPGGHWR